MRLTRVAVAVAAVLFLSGCISVYTPAIGVLFTEVSGPVTTTGKVGVKEGRACAQSILGLIAQGDASIAAAAKAGGISKIDSVSTYTRNMLGVVGDFCTVVRGS